MTIYVSNLSRGLAASAIDFGPGVRVDADEQDVLGPGDVDVPALRGLPPAAAEQVLLLDAARGVGEQRLLADQRDAGEHRDDEPDRDEHARPARVLAG